MSQRDGTGRQRTSWVAVPITTRSIYSLWAASWPSCTHLNHSFPAARRWTSSRRYQWSSANQTITTGQMLAGLPIGSCSRCQSIRRLTCRLWCRVPARRPSAWWSGCLATIQRSDPSLLKSWVTSSSTQRHPFLTIRSAPRRQTLAQARTRLRIASQELNRS